MKWNITYLNWDKNAKFGSSSVNCAKYTPPKYVLDFVNVISLNNNSLQLKHPWLHDVLSGKGSLKLNLATITMFQLLFDNYN